MVAPWTLRNSADVKWSSPLVGIAIAVAGRWVPYLVWLFVLALFGVGPEHHDGVALLPPLLAHLGAVGVGAWVSGRLARSTWAPMVVAAWVTASALIEWGDTPAWYLLLFCAAAPPLALLAGHRGARR
jgi:hypothetical protein